MTKKKPNEDAGQEEILNEANESHEIIEEAGPVQDEQTNVPALEQESEQGLLPDEASLEALQGELAEARQKADEYLDGWQRSRAEFTNYKKRVEKEQSQTYQVAAGSVIKRFLGVVDDLERALKNRPQDGDGAVWAEGVELIYRKLLNILENEGVTPIQALGQPFDPNIHEAVISEESNEHESGQVIEVLQQGYTLGDKVLRPAMVRVAR
jgi:molecular chaperone GrpE